MYVYILKSMIRANRFYTGLSDDPERRLSEHNRGLSWSTRRLRPLRLVATIRFEDPDTAERFEKYLKSGSGRAFAKRHFQ
jgi:predicted GIY-YIG superfamily endonuclease